LTFGGVFETQNYKKIEGFYINEEISQWLRDNSMGIKNLDVSSLQILICGELTTLPEGLGNLTSLTTLYLFECWSLTTLSEGLGNLTSLTTLDLPECSSLTT
jgi:Leucine-rich repeat (LRR) protein